MTKKFLLIGMAALLAACSPHVQKPSSPVPVTVPAPSVLPPPGAYRFGEQSELRILVYRSGALSNLGHNHVMLNRMLTGGIKVGTDWAASSFELSLPVSGFIVDDTHARQEEGADFPGEIPQDARSGTLHNMQSEAVLNAAAYKEISVKSLGVRQSAEGIVADMQVQVAGHEGKVSAPFTVARQGQGFLATADFELKQSALSMTPYSLMHGALAVKDAMRIKLKLSAVPLP